MENPLCPPADPDFCLIETLRWQPGAGFLRGARHLARLARSAARLGISPVGVEHALAQVRGAVPLRVRLTVDRGGRPKVTCAPYVPLPVGTVWNLALSATRLCSTDPWLGLKSSQRQLYDTTRAALPAGVDEVVFLNENNALCEGTITNLFVQDGDTLLTPPLGAGVLPGVLREELLASGRAREADLDADDARGKPLFVGNSLRGLIPARIIS